MVTYGRILFGGATSGEPALKPNGAVLEARLADDSAYADFKANATTIFGNLDIQNNNFVAVGGVTMYGSGTGIDMQLTGVSNCSSVTNAYGLVSLGGVGSTSHSLGAGDTLIGNDVEVDGATYLDGAVVMMSSLPTSDPANAGQLWIDTTDGYTIKVSQG
jgi:hypothetical protein